MPKTPAGQLSLDSLFDTTAISSGFTLGGESVARPVFDDDEDEAPAAPPVVAFRPPAKNWRLDGHRLLAPNWKGRAADNLAAIRLLQGLEREDRTATAEEQEQLARFTAFGGGDLSQSMFRRAGEDFRGGWEDLGRELEQLVNQEEIAGLARATQYAHYTPEFMVRAMWDALIRIGFSGGNVLEPGCGTGLFLAMLPEKAAGKVALTGIEADPITARIAAKLFPEAWIRAEDFTKARLTERYDVVIGNPPFSDRTVRADDAAGKLHLSLHDYFIARSIERLKPGGVAAFVTSRWTMDKSVATAREHIATMADLIGCSANAAGRDGGGCRHRGSGRRAAVPAPPARRRGPRRGLGHGRRGRTGHRWRGYAAREPLLRRASRDGAGRPRLDHQPIWPGLHLPPAFWARSGRNTRSGRSPSSPKGGAFRLRIGLQQTVTRLRASLSAPRPRAPRSRRAATS